MNLLYLILWIQKNILFQVDRQDKFIDCGLWISSILKVWYQCSLVSTSSTVFWTKIFSSIFLFPQAADCITWYLCRENYSLWFLVMHQLVLRMLILPVILTLSPWVLLISSLAFMLVLFSEPWQEFAGPPSDGLIVHHIHKVAPELTGFVCNNWIEFSVAVYKGGSE